MTGIRFELVRVTSSYRNRVVIITNPVVVLSYYVLTAIRKLIGGLNCQVFADHGSVGVR